MKMITRTLTADSCAAAAAATSSSSTCSKRHFTHVYYKRRQQCTEQDPQPPLQHYHHQRQRHYYFPNNSFSLFVLFSCLLFFFCSSSSLSLLTIANALDVAAPAPVPHVATLVSAGVGSSSILEQFSPNCSAVSHIFQARGIDAAEIPQKPSNEMVLRYCEPPSVGTCCTYNMETKMAMQSRLQLERHSKEQIAKMSSTLGAKAQKFNEVFRKLLLESKEEFHNMFTRTYGVIYQQNSYVFSDLFNELENYFARGRVDLIEVMDKFFNVLYQKMFQVLNSQYSFDEKYLRCVSEHMKELKPFGDVPDKLSVQIKRSFVATRTYGQALATAAEVSKKLINVRLNADCTAALTKMQHCGACKGYAEKPCTNYCVNVIKGCLHYFNDFDEEWENFASAMDRLAERLLGSFNIVMVVEPINIKISEAIMNFQDAGQDITSRVFQGCGRPTLGRSKRALNPKLAVTQTVQSVVAKVDKNRATALQESDPIHAEQIESDILDIDAALDDAIVLRERRAADPASPRDSVGAYSDEQSSSSPRSSSGSNTNNNNNNNNGNSNSNSNNNRRNNQKRKQQNRKNDDNEFSGRDDPVLDKMVRDIRQRVKDSKKFWANLPHQICNNDDIASSADTDGMCWNGHTIDRYMHSITTEHGKNPEFPGNPATTRQTAQVATQLFYLKNVIGHLRNAYNGQDVDWSDQEEPYYGSGSGSGGGSDDEDDSEGSGLGGSPFTPSHKPDHTDHPAVRINNVDDEDEEDVDEHVGVATGGGSVVTHTTRPKYTGTTGTGGSSSSGPAHETNELDEQHNGDENEIDSDDDIKSNGSSSTAKPQKMTLRRALLLYLLPLFMAWFGGICADLL